MYRASFTLCIVGVSSCIVAIVLPLVFPLMFEKKLTDMLIIKPGTEIFENYKKSTVPINYEIYIFNVTNADEILLGAKPILDEIGPYTYRLEKQRTDIKFNDSIGTVSSKSLPTYYFQPQLSVGNESDIFTTVNLVFTILASKIDGDHISPIVKGIAEVFFMRFNLKPFMTHTVGEILFQGYNEPVLKVFYPLTKKENHRVGKTSYYYSNNGTAGNEMEVNTGILNMEHYQDIYKFNGLEELSVWKEHRCNMINGTNGSQFPRPIDIWKPLRVFSPSLCRSAHFMYEKDINLGPLTLHRFIMAPELLEKSEENQCFCSSEFSCRASMIDIAPCKGGSPIIISLPHFLYGDPADINAVIGLNPRKEIHETVLDIEHITGVTLQAAKRSQINLPFRKYGNLPSLSNITELIFPVIWINDTVSMSLDRAKKLHATLTVPATLVKYSSGALIIIGLILIFIGVRMAYKVHKKNSTLSKRRQQFSDKKFETTQNKLF